MPQGTNKSESEVVEFQVMLPNINLLYLFCDVLIVLDMTYMGRFWYRSPKHSLHIHDICMPCLERSPCSSQDSV